VRGFAITHTLANTLQAGAFMEAVYSWQAAYNAALVETNPDLRPERVYKALLAIEERLLSLIKQNSDEFQALRLAAQSLEADF
jgi:hypothetical protein